MQEKILVTPSKNGLSSSLAYKGKALFNVRIITPIELARLSLLRCGKICKKEFISKDEELVYYKSIIEEVTYFKTTKLADIKNINNTINTIRQLIVEDELNNLKDKLYKGSFIDKNKAIYEVYEKYINRLDEEEKIDTIGLIRYAIDKVDNLDLDIITLKEYPLQPLDIQLIKKISKEYEIKSLCDLYEVKDKNIHIESYKNCYGESNEAGIIIDDILANHPSDQCVIACADYPKYSQIFYDYSAKYNLNLTFGNGLSLINSYPGKLLKQYYYWTSAGNYGWQPFIELINSPYFNFELLKSNLEINTNDFWKRVSKLRITNNINENKKTIEEFKKAISRNDINDNDKLEKYLNDIEIVINEFNLPIEEFINKYSRNRIGEFASNFDEAAKTTIINEIKTIKNIGLDITDDIIEVLLKKMVYRQGNKPGYIHICSISDGLSSLRNVLYVCGLSSTTYPGSPKENPLLLDEDLSFFDNEDLSSKGKIIRKKEDLLNLVKLASSLDNKIYLSYPGLNVSELKKNNASSLLFELYKTEHGLEKSLKDFLSDVEKVEYFEPRLSTSRTIGQAYNNNDVINFIENVSNNNINYAIEADRYSPSALNLFFSCRKQFYYQYVLKIASPDDYDPYEVISANEQGTLAHSLMEYLPDHKMDKETFIKFSSDVFDEYMKISVPLIKENIENTKQEFLDMLANGWEFDNRFKREVAFKEEDKTTIHKESGVKIHGYPDRVELTKDGKAIIVDFKTERKMNSHIKDDVNTCLQVLIYAYIVEKEMNLEIDHCEYRMLRFTNGIITCKYDDEIKKELADKLITFKNAIDNSDYHIEPFTSAEEKLRCKYCKYSSICGKVVVDDE